MSCQFVEAPQSRLIPSQSSIIRALYRQNGAKQLVGFVFFEVGFRFLVQVAAILVGDCALVGIAGGPAICEVSVHTNAGLAQRAV